MGAFQYRTTIDVNGSVIDDYADFKEGEALIETTLEDSPIEDINLTLSQNSGGTLDNFDHGQPLDCVLSYRDYDLNATFSSTTFYHKPTTTPDAPGTECDYRRYREWLSQLIPDSISGTWAPTIDYPATAFHIKCEVTLTDPGQNGSLIHRTIPSINSALLYLSKISILLPC